MLKEFLKFDSHGVEKRSFFQNLIAIDNIDIDKMVISKGFAYNKNKKKVDAKFFIGYKDDK